MPFVLLRKLFLQNRETLSCLSIALYGPTMQFWLAQVDTHIQTYIHIFIHTRLDTHMHTHRRTHIHTYIRALSRRFGSIAYSLLALRSYAAVNKSHARAVRPDNTISPTPPCAGVLMHQASVVQPDRAFFCCPMSLQLVQDRTGLQYRHWKANTFPGGQRHVSQSEA